MPASQKLIVAIATYNELENLPLLLEEIWQRLPDATILVVDDNSPDGTPAWLAQQKSENADGDRHKLEFIVRAGKLGLGSAAAAAFAWALERDFTWLATMDADFSHRPQDLQAVYEVAQREPSLDVVIGSRYVSGGKIVGWPWRRRVASRWINRLTRFCLRLKTRDNSGALRIYRVAMLKDIQADQLHSSGYVYLQEMLWRLHRRGAKCGRCQSNSSIASAGNPKSTFVKRLRRFHNWSAGGFWPAVELVAR